MKKYLFITIIFIFYIGKVNAFDIDINKVSVDSVANQLNNNLNKTYNIDTSGFSNDVIVDENINKLIKEVVKISLSSDSVSTKKQQFTKYMHYSSNDGAETLSGSIFIELYLKKIEEDKIEAEYIKDIRTVKFNQDDAMTFVYLNDALVGGKEKEVVLAFWLKKDISEYRVYYPWLTIDDDLDEYFRNVTNSEDNGKHIGGTYNKVSLSGKGEVVVNTEKLEEIYQANKNKVVQITGMSDGGEGSYGSGFFLREGIVVTTWSLFLKMLTNSDYIYVNDSSGNTYDILGVVAAQVDYDVVVLKINKNSGIGVNFESSSDLEVDDKLFMINSKNNGTFSISYGSFISLDSGRLKNMFLLSSSDVGAALFNEDGNVVAFTVGDKVNSELSYANSTSYLVELQEILNKQDYSKISYTLLETFKQDYYSNVQEEKTYNKIPKEIWNKYKKIGNLESKIDLKLLKASYVDDIVSLRYENKVSNLIDSMYLVTDFTDNLIRSGYEFTYSDSYKKIYKNNKYKIVIKNSLNYLIIIIMES